MARTTTALKGLRTNRRLEVILPELYRINREKAQLERDHDRLRDEALPLVELAGDSYTTKDGVLAKISRPKTWKVDPIGLLEKFGEKVRSLLEVSPKKFREAFNSGLLGPAKGLAGIAELEDTTPQLLVTKK